MKRFLYLALGVALAACSGDKSGQQAAGGSKEFAVETIALSSADLSTKYPATIKGVQDIEIRPKVSGNITRQLVDEGDFVHAGQPLFIIDPTQYQAAVDQAQAAVNVAKASVQTQQLTVDNKKQLLAKQIISQYDYDVAANTLSMYEAQLGQAQAALRSAKDQLSYCTVRATSSGVIGEIPYRVGSLVSASIAAPLTTVSNLEKMYAYFSMTEKQFLQLTRENGGSEAARMSLPEVTLILADGSIYGELGKVTSFSGVIDPTTGSLQMRATFANPDKLLRSGATGVLQFPVRRSEAIVIPQKASYAIQDKRFVYVVGKDNKVKNTEITVLEQHDGENFVVTGGLKAGDRLVVEGVNQLKDGMEIKPITVAQSEAQRQKSKEHMATKAMPGQ